MALSLRRRAVRLGSGHDLVWLFVAYGVAVVSLSAHSLVAEARGGSPAAHPQRQVVSPQPLPDNPSPDYPVQALAAAVDGDVVFVARVSAEGRVDAVQVLDVPKAGMGFEDAVREAVLQWRFEAARNDRVAIPSAYVGKVNFTRQLSYAHARMYSESSQAVWREAKDIVTSLERTQGITYAVSQVLITQWLRFDTADVGQPPAESAGPGQGLPQEFQLHVFVSPFVEPARVHVGSVSRGPNNVQYNLGVAERWFFEKLERRLGEVGLPIPLESERHRAAASSLLDVPDPCLGTVPTDASAVAVPTRLTAVAPTYLGLVASGTDATITVKIAVSLDGAVVSSQVVGTEANAVEQDMATAAAGVVSLWRFSPSTSEGCRVPFTGKVNVTFPRQ